MLQLPIIDELKKSNNILLAGCGGGYDVFSALPLYFALKQEGKNVHLANFSFSLSVSSLKIFTYHSAENSIISETCLKVTADTIAIMPYFPEAFLSQWFRKVGQEVPIYCFQLSGVKPLKEAYNKLKELLNLDTIVLVDGGTDSLMRGNECDLGTPSEDMTSILAVNEIDVERKMLMCLGFGIDRFHGVCHSQFLENSADMIKKDGFLGAFTVTKDMPEFMLYEEAYQFVLEKMPRNPSIVCSSIIDAINGEFGDHHSTLRTGTSKLYINPLMSMYWSYKVKAIADEVMYPKEILETTRMDQVAHIIHDFRKTISTKPRQEIPL